MREAAAADLSAWLELWAGYNAFHDRVGPKAIPEAVTQTTWARFHDPAEPMHCLLAELDDAMVGMAHLIFHRNATITTHTCYLQDLFTAPAARGKGVGRALIESVYTRARAAGSPRVYWQTHETNAPAQRVYDALASRSGFIVYRKDL